jgi:hypothetical protein
LILNQNDLRTLLWHVSQVTTHLKGGSHIRSNAGFRRAPKPTFSPPEQFLIGQTLVMVPLYLHEPLSSFFITDSGLKIYCDSELPTTELVAGYHRGWVLLLNNVDLDVVQTSKWLQVAVVCGVGISQSPSTGTSLLRQIQY